MTWTSTIHCRSRAHCRTCRTDPAWRAQAGAPDACPIGLEIGAQDIPAPPSQPPGPPPTPPCRHMRDTGEKVDHRPCCHWIVCQNPACPIYQQEHLWRTQWCSPEKCRFYTARDENRQDAKDAKEPQRSE